MINTVGDLLTHLEGTKGKKRGVIKIDASALTDEAADRMHEKGINLLVVTSNGVFVGVVSTSDTSAALRPSMRPSERTVAQIMTTDVKLVSTEDDLMELPKRFDLGKRTRHLVVTDPDGKWSDVLDANEVLEGVMANIAQEEQQQAQVDGEFPRT